MLPNSVKHRDGRLVPFDSDIISQNLFAAAQTLGSADAFLVRELTDGVLHFLAQEDFGDIVAADSLDDFIEKIVGQLEQPALARAFRERIRPVIETGRAGPTLTVPYHPAERPESIAARCVEQFALRSGFAPDIAAAHEQKLIHLGGLQTPHLLDTVVLDPIPANDGDAWTWVRDGAARASNMLVFEGPEWMIAKATPDEIGTFIDQLFHARELYGRRMVLHVGGGDAPAWARPLAAGPLFQENQTQPPCSSEWWLKLADHGRDSLRAIWHWRDAAASNRHLLDSIQQKLELPSCGLIHEWSVAFDRPGHPVALSNGLDRRRPAILLDVCLDLPRLLNRPDVACQAAAFLDKLPSLSRLAVSAGVQKRAYLRRLANDKNREVLLERAAVRIVPLGFSQAIEQLLGVPTTATKPARTLAREILRRLESPLDAERRRTSLDLVLAAPTDPIRLDPQRPHETLKHIDEILDGPIRREARTVRLIVTSKATNWDELLQFAYRETTLAELDIDLSPDLEK